MNRINKINISLSLKKLPLCLNKSLNKSLTPFFPLRTFCTTPKFSLNKFKKLSETVKIQNPSIPKDITQEEKFALDKHGPKPGETLPLPVLDSKGMALQMGIYEAFDRDPVSSYYSVKINDKLYHVFNAARIPLGRMCARAAFILQGKNTPFYQPNKVTNTDKIIIVNAKYTWLTGKKNVQKLYRNHTGYPGGLKSIRAKDYLEKNPCEMVWRSLKGMLPKNKLRHKFLENVEIIEEGGHTHGDIGLPQFGKINPVDYNEVFGFSLDPKVTKIVKTDLNEEELEKHFKGFDVEIDESLAKPRYMTTPKTTENVRMKTKFEKYAMRHRVRMYRNIRNKAYRYM